MDPTTAVSVLTDMMRHLPPEEWWALQEADDNSAPGLPTAFHRPRAEIDALLINAGMYKKYGKKGKLAIIANGWEEFERNLPAPLEGRTIRKDPFVSNGLHLQHDHPKKQIQANVRLQNRAVLPDKILQLLKQSADHFDGKNDEAARAAKARAEEAAKKEAEERARKEAQLAKAIQYPLLSSVVGHDEVISLDNPKVKEWSASALTEVIQLHTDQEVDISIQ